MAEFDITVSTGENFLSRFANAILRKSEAKIKKNQRRATEIAKRAVVDAVQDNKNLFIPTDDEAGELGVGQGGQIDRGKTEGAYKQLFPSHPNTVTTIDVSSRKVKISLRVSIDFLELYESELANIGTESSIFPVIPWLNWLVNGAPVTVSGYRYTTRDVNGAKFSRTGKGIMVKRPAGAWDFPPARFGAEQILELAIRETLIQKLKKELGAKLYA